MSSTKAGRHERVLRVDDGEFTRLSIRRGPDDWDDVIPIVRFEPAASFEEIEFFAAALHDMRFVLDALSRTAALVRELRFQPVSAGRSAPASVHGLAQPSAACPATEGGNSPASEERAAQRDAAGPASLPGDQPGVSDTAREAKAPPDYAAECAMKCEAPVFKKFLEECHGLERPLTDERVAVRVRSILDIKSRRELNEDPAAARRWRALVKDFDLWRKQDQGAR